MRFILAILFAGAAAAAPAFFCRRPTCGEAYLRTRVSVDLQNSTLRQLFRELERQTGYPVATACSCGALLSIDEADLTFHAHDLPAGKVLLIATRPGMIHRGDWLCERNGVVLTCGRRGCK